MSQDRPAADRSSSAGQPDPDLEAWLEANPPGEAELAAYRAAERLVAEASPLSRRACPEPEQLVVPQGQTLARALERHLEACVLCRDDLADFQALTAAPAPGLVAKLSLALAEGRRWLEVIASTLDTAPGALEPARGGEAPTSLVQRAPFGEGVLRLEWGAARGAVDLQATAQGTAPRPFRVDLRERDEQGAAGSLLESRSCDEDGHVRLSGLAPGSYWLHVWGPHADAPCALELELDLRP